MSAFQGFTEKEKNDVIRKLAGFLSSGVPEGQAAEALGVDRQTVWVWKQDPLFVEVYAQKQAEKAQEFAEMNNGWDSIEKKALRILDDNLRINKNAEFALKVAAVSNKAMRRGNGVNSVLPAQQGTTVNLTLNQKFIKKIQTANIVGRPETPNDGKLITHGPEATNGPLPNDKSPALVEGPLKETDMLMPAQVERLLTAEVPLGQLEEMQDLVFTAADVRDQ